METLASEWLSSTGQARWVFWVMIGRGSLLAGASGDGGGGSTGGGSTGDVHREAADAKMLSKSGTGLRVDSASSARESFRAHAVIS